MSLPPPSSDPALQRRWFRLAAWVAICGAFLACIADILLLYAPEGGYFGDPDYLYLPDLDSTRLTVGHFLGILAIPLEAAGLYLIFLGMRPMNYWTARLLPLSGLYFMFPGVAYHGSLFALARLRQQPGINVLENLPAEAKMEALRPYSEFLAVLFVLGFGILFGLFTWYLARGKTLFARRTAFFSPIVIYPLALLLYLSWPPVGNFILPMGFNFAMLVFFVVLARQQSRVLVPG